jgi:hypothetical protein
VGSIKVKKASVRPNVADAIKDEIEKATPCENLPEAIAGYFPHAPMPTHLRGKRAHSHGISLRCEARWFGIAKSLDMNWDDELKKSWLKRLGVMRKSLKKKIANSNPK